MAAQAARRLKSATWRANDNKPIDRLAELVNGHSWQPGSNDEQGGGGQPPAGNPVGRSAEARVVRIRRLAAGKKAGRAFRWAQYEKSLFPVRPVGAERAPESSCNGLAHF